MTNVAIIGASGYTGLELVKILTTHPKFNISYIATSSGDTTISQLHSSLCDVVDLAVQKVDCEAIAKVAELAFLALPHKTSMQIARKLLDLGVKIVDLSADYRLSLELYEKHYCPHEDKANIPYAVYGLPEYYAQNIAQASLVANPGCYPTVSLLCLLPFVPYLNNNCHIFIDAKSGVSGAGKKPSETTNFVNINENMVAYNPFKHRHMPEIKEQIEKLTDKSPNINFVPNLVPITRGMIVSIYATLEDNMIDTKQILNEFYQDDEFVRVKDTPVHIKQTSGTNFCDIFVEQNGSAIFINGCIDNLLRGASSQAVVNANIMCGFEQNLAIPKIAYVP